MRRCRGAELAEEAARLPCAGLALDESFSVCDGLRELDEASSLPGPRPSLDASEVVRPLKYESCAVAISSRYASDSWRRRWARALRK